MRERADELGGRFSIDSDPSGTVVRARLPIVDPA
jgi:signal transduction histidine kinase